jgi:hypothetical protein
VQGDCRPQSLIEVAVCQHKNIYNVFCRGPFKKYVQAKFPFTMKWFQINAPFLLVGGLVFKVDIIVSLEKKIFAMFDLNF